MVVVSLGGVYCTVKFPFAMMSPILITSSWSHKQGSVICRTLNRDLLKLRLMSNWPPIGMVRGWITKSCEVRGSFGPSRTGHTLSVIPGNMTTEQKGPAPLVYSLVQYTHTVQLLCPATSSKHVCMPSCSAMQTLTSKVYLTNNCLTLFNNSQAR